MTIVTMHSGRRLAIVSAQMCYSIITILCPQKTKPEIFLHNFI